MIKIERVSIKYVKDYYSLFNVNLGIDGNSLLIGSDISGNNFLLRILAKIDKGYEGEIFVDDKNLKQIKDKDLNLAYITKIPCLFKNKSVLENLIYPLKIRKISKKEAILRAKTALKPYFLKIFEIFNETNNEIDANSTFNCVGNIQKDKTKIHTTNNVQNNNFKTNNYNKSNKENLDLNDAKIKQNFENLNVENLVLDNKKFKNFSNQLLNFENSNLDLNNEKFENVFDKFLNLKVKKLDLSTKKIISLLRAKIREPKYVLIENFFENLDIKFFELANEIISNFTSTIIATQSGTTTPPAYKSFKQFV